MQPSEYKILISVESYDEKLLKTTEIATLRKAYSFQAIKGINFKFY